MSSIGRPVGSEAGRVPHLVVFTSGEDSVGIPLANDGVGLGPSSSSSGPVDSHPLPADRSASAASSSGWLHGVGVVRRAIPSPGPLWRRLRIFYFGSTVQRGFAFPPSGAVA